MGRRAEPVDTTSGAVLMAADQGEYRRVIAAIDGHVRYESQGTYRTCKAETFRRWARKSRAKRVNG